MWLKSDTPHQAWLERKRNWIRISSQESDELEDLERLANDIFDEEGYQFHGFYENQTVRDIFGDSDDESELFERFNVTSKCWTILKAAG